MSFLDLHRAFRPGASSAPLAALALCAAVTAPLLAPAAAPSVVRGPAACADEGLWLLTAPPLAQLEERYGFRPDPKWLEHMQKSAVRFETGGSGSFVSADGLVLTNHHVGSDMIEKLSTPERDLLRDGFLASSREEELKCPDLELRVLWSIEDVTDRVNAAVTPDMDPAAAFAARRKAMAEIERESKEQTGLLSEVVTLYHGGRYHLYRYRQYTDVRLVFAPESQAAAFGGDADNFEYPRQCLDMALFRVYEDGKPLRPDHYLTVSPDGVSDGELILVFGHPGRTQRSLTTDHLRFLRDVDLPLMLDWTSRREAELAAFAGNDAESARQAEGDLHGLANSRKARTGMLAALQDPSFLKAKEEAEAKLKARIDANPEAKAAAEGAWEQVAKSLEADRELYARYQALETARGAGQLFGIARTLVRLASELEKPNAERLPEYRDGNLPSVELELYSTAPIYPALETERLKMWLTKLAEILGGDDPVVRAALGDESPDARARRLVSRASLADVALRRRVAQGGQATIEGARDPLLQLARDIDAAARAVRKEREDTVLGPQREAYARLANARFMVEGDSVYPDATFTLRLSYGPVKGYVEDGKLVPPFTTLGSAFEKAEAHGDSPDAPACTAGLFALPKRWWERRDQMDLSTPYNFVAAADIIGGNSGSPVVNEAGELVGLIFDGTIDSLSWDFAYDDRTARATSVDVRAILEALRKIYDAGHLADEMQGGTTTGSAARS